MTDESEPTAADGEFDRTQWPELVAYKVMPAISQDVLEVEITDVEGNTPTMEVPKGAVILTNMPQILRAMRQRPVPEEIVKSMEESVGLGLLACRVIERFDENNLVRLELPTNSEKTRILVAAKSLAKRR